MADIQKGDTFVDGQTINGARLNALVDSAIILAAFISGKAQVVPLGADSLVIYQNSSGQLKKALISALPFVTSVAMTVPAEFSVAGSPITGTGTLAVSKVNQTQNKVYAAPTAATGPPTFRALQPLDLFAAPASIAVNDIDWSLPNWVFQKTITGVFTPTFSNVGNGQSIQVFIQQGGGGSITWSIANLRWPGGVAPAINATVGRVDLYEFTERGTLIFGRAFQNFF